MGEKKSIAREFRGYRYRLERFAKRHSKIAPEELKPYHVEKWAASYPVSKTTRRNYMRAVKRCYRWAKQQGYIETNPIADLEVPSAENREVVIRPAEFEQFIACSRHQTVNDVLVTAWETGCRPQELVKVTAQHVDLANQRWVFKQSESKMKRVVRVVYLGERSVEIARRLIAAYPTGPVFRNSKGRPWKMTSLNSAIKRLRIRLGQDEVIRQGGVTQDEVNAYVPKLSKTKMVRGKKVAKSDRELRGEATRKIRDQKAKRIAQGYSLYAIRHSFATNALENGVDALTVAVLMGHKDPSTLARVYQHLSHNPKHLLEQARRATKSA